MHERPESEAAADSTGKDRPRSVVLRKLGTTNVE
jgi:hypothetical protein